jgi:hypothetical protein
VLGDVNLVTHQCPWKLEPWPSGAGGGGRISSICNNISSASSVGLTEGGEGRPEERRGRAATEKRRIKKHCVSEVREYISAAKPAARTCGKGPRKRLVAIRHFNRHRVSNR